MTKKPIAVESLRHDAATRKNIPTAEYESVMSEAEKTPVQLAYPRRNPDLDPQLVWRGKDVADWSDLIVAAPPLYIQEKVHPKVIIDDLKREARRRAMADAPPAPDLFADFNGLPDREAATEFYAHDQHWSNRMISGDSLSVMASLAEREGLRGKVQCIYFDPPYGIKFNSNFQWSTTSRDVKDGARDQITREPEQVRAFRDTWRDGIHSYLTYLRDRLTVARDLLHESGSIFVQIGDENVHRVRAVMDEVFGESNYISSIIIQKVTGVSTNYLTDQNDVILFYAKNSDKTKFRRMFVQKMDVESASGRYSRAIDSAGQTRVLTAAEKDDPTVLSTDLQAYRGDNLVSSEFRPDTTVDFTFQGNRIHPGSSNHWKTSLTGLARASKATRIEGTRGAKLQYIRQLADFAVIEKGNVWTDISGAVQSRSDPKIYVVQTSSAAVARCILMATDPGDLVLDPTCGSGTTATVAEQWGRRWITIDTSRVAIALARSRLMGARYPYYLLADSPEGQRKEGEVTRSAPKMAPTRGDVRHGFVYERVPHITLKSIANNAEIDVIWERRQPAVDDARAALNAALKGHPVSFKVETGGRAGATIDFAATGEVTLPSGEAAPADGFMEWEIPREAPEVAGKGGWPPAAREALARFWDARIARQKEIDASIAARAEFEYLYDKPYADNSRVRVAGPFTVESLSPHRTLAVDQNDELIDLLEAAEGRRKTAERGDAVTDFAHMILENLKAAGLQQAHKADRISFTSLTGWPGRFICAEGLFLEGEPGGSAAGPDAAGAGASPKVKRAGIFIGPEFGTVSRPDLVAAAREAGDAGFDVLVACAFSYDAHSAEFDRLGRVTVLKARMNPDLHMGADLKATGAGNLFVIFGEPDIRFVVGGTAKCLMEIENRKARIQTINYELTGHSKLKDDETKAVVTRLQLEKAKGERFIAAAEALPDDQVLVEIWGVDVFKPQTGEVISEGTDGIALWMLDTDYNEESFFVRHAYFLGANDPYKALKTTLKAEIDQEAWDTLHSDTSRPFAKPASGRIAVKVINHLGDEVMKVFTVE
ncbi:site-specific DNA-methyltransferase [Methylobrevis albus]|uniref:site-specific DNA-methyltransferase n=1 Tax=Methylobrevis albus TaxID=2793297 RepID=UPI001F3EEC65|nr:site-specific DNA-methyltransferase [Methylobrevis albus]